MPFTDRKQLLKEIISYDTGLLAKVKYIEGHGPAYFDLVWQQGLEGIVLKRKESHFEVGKRSQSWLKVINYQYEDVLITGFRKGQFGLLLRFLDGRPAGIMEFMQPAERKNLYQQHHVVTEDDKLNLIEPIKCQVEKVLNLFHNRSIVEE